MRAERRNAAAQWQEGIGWGEVREFLSYEWGGKIKCVAIIDTAKVKSNWIPGKPPGVEPQLLHRHPARPTIQVVDLKAVTSVAGRVPRKGESGMIVFDITNGLLDPAELP
jgi:hypothetical protein